MQQYILQVDLYGQYNAKLQKAVMHFIQIPELIEAITDKFGLLKSLCIVELNQNSVSLIIEIFRQVLRHGGIGYKVMEVFQEFM